MFVKKIAAFTLGMSLLTVAAPLALAEHPVYSDDNTQVIAVLSDAAVAEAQAESYARQNPATALVVAAGVILTNGTLLDPCPIWFFKFQCVAPQGWYVAQ